MLDFLAMISMLILIIVFGIMLFLAIICIYSENIFKTPKEKFYDDEEQMKIVSSDEYKNKSRRK